MYISRFFSEKEQLLKDHLFNVSNYARDFAKNLKAENCLMLCGILHDIGKYSDEFQIYIKKEQDNDRLGIDEKQKKVDHGVYGAKFIYNLAKGQRNLTADILSEVVCYHHGGLPDNISDDRVVPLIERMSNVSEDKYNDVVGRFFKDNPKISMEMLTETFADASQEINNIVLNIPKDKRTVYISFLIKNIYSILVDADRLDSYLFTVGYEDIKNYDSHNLWINYNECLQEKLNSFKESSVETKLEEAVKMAREEASDRCRKFAEKETGIYNLTVPTGGGKTLASLNFALNHAIKHKKQRIIYVIPYTSIIEQNAKEVRGILNAKDTLLEYHSNIINTDKDESTEQFEIFAERWTSPIIFTTMVQFLNSVFANGNGNIRRMRSLENSVIIFDEIQTLPIKCINLFYTLIGYLRDVSNTTSILCTATQPNVSEISEKLGAIRVDGEIIKNREEIFALLERMKVIDKTDINMDYEEASDFICDIKSNVNSVLAVVNTVSSAINLYNNIKERVNCSVYLLTSRMCPGHRKNVIEDIKKALKNKEELICVSTQLIEAGVDISFESVVRSLAGLDSVAQATGRGNRHGEKSLGYSYIIRLRDENVVALKEIHIGQETTKNLLCEYKKSKSSFDNSLLSEKAIKRYYEIYFNNHTIKDNMSYPIENDKSIYSILKNSKGNISDYNGKYPLSYCMQFKTARENFKVIDENTETVIVPYDRMAKQLIGELLSDSVIDKYDILRKLQPYSVTLYTNIMAKLKELDAFTEENRYKVFILKDLFYSDECGVILESKLNVEANMF